MRGVLAAVLVGTVSFRGTTVLAQVVSAGAISGMVKSADGLGVPGVSVTAGSEDLQGRRTVTTSPDGHYILPVLPPGDYTVSFEAAGFQTANERVRIAVGQDVTLAVTLNVAPITQSVEVDARNLAEFTHSLPLASSYSQRDLIERLPLDRTLTGTVRLAPDVQTSGPGGNLVLSGAVSYESLFLVNGVVVNDNQSGQPNPLFIEDAIQETSVTTAGVPAEYGRFSGGVVNVVTKSGGNQLSGSFRTTFSNDSWTALTPYPGDSRVEDTVPTYEATLGGRIIKDRLWFFGAGRHADTTNAAATTLTGIPYVSENDENRYEGKLTYSLTQQHTFKGSVTKIDLAQKNRASGAFLDLASLSDRTNPQRLLAGNYAGGLSPTFFLEAQVSQREYTLVGSGAKFTDLLNGTVLYDRQANNAHYHAPTSCGVCTSEQRDNYDVLVKATYFLSTARTGFHTIVAGGDVFNDRRFDNQFPSASNYAIYGTSILQSFGTIYPVFNNDGTTFIRWTPVFTPTQGTAFRTYSAFGNDAWHFADRLSVTLGIRYDKDGGTDSVGNGVVRDQAWSPRLGMTWNPDRAGVWTVNAGGARYVASILVTVADSSSPGGRAAAFDYAYAGPAVNTATDTATPVSQNAAIQTVFDWFFQNGGTGRPTRGAPSVPGLTTVIGDSLGPPSATEWTAGVARRLGSHGDVRLDAIYRQYGNFYSNRVDLSTGRVTNSLGQVFDLAVVDNGSDLSRSYRGVRTQVSLRPGHRIIVGANYTLSRTSGNYDGEAFPGGGPASAGSAFYPQYSDPQWNRPFGDLSIDQRHRVRAWTTVQVPLGRQAGDVSVGVLEFLDTGTPYGAVGAIDTRPYVQNPGYVNPPASVSYYFTSRDTYRTDAITHTDMALVYSHKLAAGRTELFLRGTIVNLFNQSGIANAGAVDQSVLTANNSSRMQPFNPFTTAPVQRVNWDYGPNFGRPLTRLAYQTPRSAGISIGCRF